MSDTRVLIVAENPLARRGLALLLAEQPGLAVVGQSGGGESLSAELDHYRPEVLAWDWGWGERTPELPDDIPAVALLNEAQQAGEAWAQGARGLLLSSSDSETLAAALRAAAGGLLVVQPGLESALAPLPNAADPVTETLTPREREVLQLLAEGLPNKIIANRLGITDHTVKFHVNAIMSKLGAQSRTEAVVRATRLGLVLL